MWPSSGRPSINGRQTHSGLRACGLAYSCGSTRYGNLPSFGCLGPLGKDAVLLHMFCLQVECMSAGAHLLLDCASSGSHVCQCALEHTHLLSKDQLHKLEYMLPRKWLKVKSCHSQTLSRCTQI